MRRYSAGTASSAHAGAGRRGPVEQHRWKPCVPARSPGQLIGMGRPITASIEAAIGQSRILLRLSIARMEARLRNAP